MRPPDLVKALPSLFSTAHRPSFMPGKRHAELSAVEINRAPHYTPQFGNSFARKLSAVASNKLLKVLTFFAFKTSGLLRSLYPGGVPVPLAAHGFADGVIAAVRQHPCLKDLPSRPTELPTVIF